MSLKKYRVVKVDPAHGTCDIADLNTGQLFTDVEVMGGSSTNGASWSVPSIPKPASQASVLQISSSTQNLIAWCGMAYGRPVILGFSRPPTGVTVTEQDRSLDTHDASGTYETIAPDGSYEVYIPGGAYLRIGTGAHEDLSGKLAAGKLPAKGPVAITITLATSQGTLTLDPSGNWNLTGAKLTINMDTTIDGNLTVTGDVAVGNIPSYLGHKHGNVQNGNGQTNSPVSGT